MRRHWLSIVGFSLCAFPLAVAAPPPDTKALAARFNALRGKMWLSIAEYRLIQREYLDWIDARVRSGANWQRMNRELETVGLLGPNSPNGADGLDTSYVGFVEPISVKSVRLRSDLLVIVAGMYRGNACSLDVTAVIYQRAPVRRLASLNAESAESPHAFYLSGLAAGEEKTSGEGIFASGWVVSNCSSTWNGKRIRIDRMKRSAVASVLVRDLAAKDSDEGENVSAQFDRDIVTFRYNGATGDGDLLSGPAVARYRIVGDRAVLVAPVALTRAGFIHEWLGMSDAEAARWSEPNALASRRSASSILAHGFQWERIGTCGGSPSVWEVAVQPNDSRVLQVFRIAGSKATELRMLSVSDTVTQSCISKDVSKGLTDVAAELPW